MGNLAEVGRDLRTSLVSLIDLRPSCCYWGDPKIRKQILFWPIVNKKVGTAKEPSLKLVSTCKWLLSWRFCKKNDIQKSNTILLQVIMQKHKILPMKMPKLWRAQMGSRRRRRAKKMQQRWQRNIHDDWYDKGGGDRKITMLMIDNINDKGGGESWGDGQRPRGDGGGGFFSLLN